MRLTTDRRVGQIADDVADLLHDRRIEKLKDQAEQDWMRTLEKLWPLKSNEKQSSAS